MRSDNAHRVKDELEATARAVNSAAIHLLRGLRIVDDRSGLTSARLSALSVLVFGGALPLGRLAAAESVSGPTMTRIVDGLCDLGLARRESHPDNGRIVLVSATAAGDRLMRAAARRRVRAITEALASLDAADRTAVVDAGPALLELAGRIRGAPVVPPDTRVRRRR